VSALVLRGDARRLPLPDGSVDLIVTSPPYYALRDYRDGDGSLAGQIGSEPTPQAYLETLWEATVEWVRVLKPEGSLFVDLGDKYAAGHGGSSTEGNGVNLTVYRNRPAAEHPTSKKTSASRAVVVPGLRPKSLMLLPERYRIGCVDRLGLIARAVIIWHKQNGLPESVTDRVRRSHEDWIHLVKQPRYYAAVDEIREPHTGGSHSPGNGASRRWLSSNGGTNHRAVDTHPADFNPLGKPPGSVWTVLTEPLRIPDHVSHALCCAGRKREGCTAGVEHFAAFPTEWPRRLILGWSPPGICLDCGQGRRPVVDKPGLFGGDTRRRSTLDGGSAKWAHRIAQPDRILGYFCACTPYTDHPGTGAGAEREQRRGAWVPGGGSGTPHADNNGGLGNNPRVGPWREYHLDRWTAPPTRPAIVLDPFGGTGTVPLVADVLGRIGIGVDLSAGYCRLARWRTLDPGERARALRVEKPAVQVDGQLSLLPIGGTP